MNDPMPTQIESPQISNEVNIVRPDLLTAPKSKNTVSPALKVMLILLLCSVTIEGGAFAFGMASTDYATVNSLSGFSNIMLFPIAILAGLVLSFYTAGLNTAIQKQESEGQSENRKNTHLVPVLVLSVAAAILSNYLLGLNILVGLSILIIAPIVGYLVWRKRGKSYSGWQKIILYILALLLGVLPGAIASFLITLMLSERACTLSSSKCY